jgi:ribosome production factor 2
MVELAVDPSTFKPMQAFEGKRKAILRIGAKPCFVFKGSAFETNEDLVKLKSLLLDYFRGEVVDKLNLAGLSNVIVCTARNDKVHFRHYGILLKNPANNSRVPRVELEPVGPMMDLTVRRMRAAPSDLQKRAMQTPRGQKSAKRKNMETGLFGDKMGRVHLGRQNYSEIALAGLKGLKKQKGEDDDKKDQSK